MAVAYDSVGPTGGGGAGQGSGGTLTWTHTTVAAATTILVGYTLDVTGADSSTATCDSVSMTSLGVVYTSGGSSVSYLQAWYINGISAGAHTIAVTESGGGVTDMVGGSIAFSGVTGLGSTFTSNTDSTPHVAVTSNTSGNLIAGFIAAGSSITATTTPATSRYVNNFEGGSGGFTGNVAGATSPATGSSVTMAWTCSSTSMALMALEVQGAAAVSYGPPLAPVPGSRPVIVAGYAGRVGAGHSL